METRDAGHGRDFVKRQRPGEMAFDVPERFLRGVHGSRLSSKRNHDARLAAPALDSPCARSAETATGPDFRTAEKMAAKELLLT
jgi:hypothetical protein